MDDLSSAVRRVQTFMACLGAGLVLVEGSRLLFPRIQPHLLLQRYGMSEKTQARVTERASVAFLIDGENTSSTLVKQALKKAEELLGDVTIKRVYGSCHIFSNKWNEVSLDFGLEQMHVPKPTIKKNSADIALAINAIELAKDGICNHFCFVTSDSDFTPLVRRLRQMKCKVLGIGERKAPETLITACNWFVFADELGELAPLPITTISSPEVSNGHQPSLSQPLPAATPAPLLEPQLELQPPSRPKKSHPPTSIATVLTQAWLDAAKGKEGAWVLLSQLGCSLRNLHHDFVITDFAKDLTELIKAYDGLFEFGKHTNGHPQVRLRQ